MSVHNDSDRVDTIWRAAPREYYPAEMHDIVVAGSRGVEVFRPGKPLFDDA
jgi:hypothetical protein